MFDQLTGSLIHDIAQKIDGAADPSGIDAHGWSHLVTSFHKAPSDLCDALTTLGRCICITYVNSKCLIAL